MVIMMDSAYSYKVIEISWKQSVFRGGPLEVEIMSTGSRTVRVGRLYN